MSKYDARTTARLLAVQALYQMDIAQISLERVIKEFSDFRFDNPLDNPLDGEELSPADVGYFEAVLRGVMDNQVEIDQTIDRLLSGTWRLGRLDSTLRAILRCGVEEILFGKAAPMKVVVAQYSDIAHAFFDGPEGGMANALLDALAQQADK